MPDADPFTKAPSPLATRRALAWAVCVLVAFGLALLVDALGPFPMIALVGGIAVVIALLRYPWLGILLLVASVPAQEFAALQSGGQSLTITRAVFPLAVGGYLIALTVSRQRPSGSRIIVPYLAFVTVMLISITWATSTSAAGAQIGRWFTAIVSFVILLQFLVGASRRRLLLFVGIMALGGVFEATYGVTQSILALGPDSFQVGDASSRAFGTFGRPNSYAGYLEMVLFPVAWVGVFLVTKIPETYEHYRRSRNDGMMHSRPARARLAQDILLAGAFCAAAAIILGGVLASYSRGAWLGVVAGGALTALLYHRRLRLAIVLAGPVLALLLLSGFAGIVPESLADRITTGFADARPFDASRITITEDNFAAAERMAHWQAGWHMFTDQPLTGVGAGNFNERYPDYYVREAFRFSRGHAHNYYIHILAETGVAGLVTYLTLIGSVALLALWVVLRAPSGFERMLALGGFGTIVSTGVHNLFENLHVLNLSVQLGLVWVLVIVAHRGWRELRKTEPVVETNL